MTRIEANIEFCMPLGIQKHSFYETYLLPLAMFSLAHRGCVLV